MYIGTTPSARFCRCKPYEDAVFTATISISVEDFALAHALSEVPAMEVEADRLAAHSRHWVMPCLWATGGDFDAFDGALEDDPTVDAVMTTAQFDEAKYYQIHWEDAIKNHLDACLDRQGSVLHAKTTNGQWELAVRFAAHDQFETFRAYLVDHDISFSLEDLRQARTPHQFKGGLTAAQREALLTAVQVGYFAIPREATMEDVAEELGISTQAASERLRRGVGQFVTTMLMTATRGSDE